MTEYKAVRCPVCMIEFELEKGLKVGDIISCSSRDTDLKIISLEPPAAEEPAFVYDSDYDDDEGYDTEK